jgi:hypothetical protein
MIPESHGQVSDHADLHGYKFTIRVEGDACVLKYEGLPQKGQMVLVPRPPCYFLRRESSEPQSFPYQDTATKAALIVMGSPIGEETRKRWNLPGDLICGEEIQGLLIKKQQIALSSRVLRKGVWCKDKGADEKDFWLFAHEK